MRNKAILSSNTPLKFFNSLRGKLILVFLAVSLLPLLTIEWFAYIYAKYALNIEIINKLVAVRDIKANLITHYFAERVDDIKIYSQNPATIAALHAFLNPPFPFYHEEKKEQIGMNF